MAPEKEKPGKSRGEGHHSAKLTWAKVDEIRARHNLFDLKNKVPMAKLAAEYGISTVMVHKIVHNKAWKR